MPDSHITITHNDTVHYFTMADDETILDAALLDGINLPYSCKHGICGTCMAKLVEGEVEMHFHASLSPALLEQGYILTCQSHPKTDKVVVDFDYV